MHGRIRAYVSAVRDMCVIRDSQLASMYVLARDVDVNYVHVTSVSAREEQLDRRVQPAKVVQQGRGTSCWGRCRGRMGVCSA